MNARVHSLSTARVVKGCGPSGSDRGSLSDVSSTVTQIVSTMAHMTIGDDLDLWVRVEKDVRTRVVQANAL